VESGVAPSGVAPSDGGGPVGGGAPGGGGEPTPVGVTVGSACAPVTGPGCGAGLGFGAGDGAGGVLDVNAGRALHAPVGWFGSGIGFAEASRTRASIMTTLPSYAWP
jgi:hypothetical protein